MKTKQIKEFRLGELFCGPGGLALAATTATIDDPEYKIVHKWANDCIFRPNCMLIPIVSA